MILLDIPKSSLTILFIVLTDILCSVGSFEWTFSDLFVFRGDMSYGGDGPFFHLWAFSPDDLKALPLLYKLFDLKNKPLRHAQSPANVGDGQSLVKKSRHLLTFCLCHAHCRFQQRKSA
jgi:hypothetical protein